MADQKPASPRSKQSEHHKDDKPSHALGSRLRGRRGGLWLPIFVGIATIYIILAIVFAFGVYRGGWSGPITKSVTSIIPLPAADVRGGLVSYHGFLTDVDSIKHYYVTAQKVNFKTKDGKTRLDFIKSQVLSQQVENKLIAEEAAKRKVTVSQKEVLNGYKTNQGYNQIVKNNGGEAKVRDILKKYYGWDVSELKKRIREQILRAKLTEAFQSDKSFDAQAKKQAENIRGQLKSDGSNFANLAKKYSDDTSASQGGELGFADPTKYVPEFAKAIETLTIGEISQPIKTQFGYHIIQVEEKKDNQIRARHILIKTQGFQSWLTSLEQAKNIHRYIKTTSRS